VIINEISFYEGFSKKFTQYLNTYLGEQYNVYYSCNKTLDFIVSDLEKLSGTTIKEKGTYIPKLKVDIVFAISSPSKKIRMILIEAKYLNQLSLKDYSQLVGYLQVAKTIDLGLLLLIQKGMSSNKLSNDFQEILRLKKLPMDWFIDMKKINEQYNFKTGIINYLPAGGIDWIDTKDINGISSFEELAEILKS
jgi:hypothetical protein